MNQTMNFLKAFLFRPDTLRINQIVPRSDNYSDQGIHTKPLYYLFFPTISHKNRTPERNFYRILLYTSSLDQAHRDLY
jgi:hypothetical protein